MGAVSFKPESALAYYGDTIWGGDTYRIGMHNSYDKAFSVRYTFKAPKRMKGFTAKVYGTKTGSRDGQFIYQLSTKADFPKSWKGVKETGENYILVESAEELKAGETYYLFIGKSTAGNKVYYDGCSARNMTITGEAVEAGHIFRNGEWKDAEAKVYRNGAWQDAAPGEYKGEWSELG